MQVRRSRAGPAITRSQLLDTRRAFDSVAADYDGPLGNNIIAQRMRTVMWQTITAAFAPGSRLLDLGCGAGIDAEYLADQGYEIVAIDWSPEMVERTRARAREHYLSDWIAARTMGIQNLDLLADEEPFDAIYSDLGPLNCVPDLESVSEWCAGLLRPGGWLVVSAAGHGCPWEYIYYAAHRDIGQARMRATRGSVPVSLGPQTVWTRYYAPNEFYSAFINEFRLVRYRALALFMPPPHLLHVARRLGPLAGMLNWLDNRLGGLPFLRDAGDHFLMILEKRG